MFTLNEDDEVENFCQTTLIHEDQNQWTSTFDRLFYSYQRYNELRRKDDAIK